MNKVAVIDSITSDVYESISNDAYAITNVVVMDVVRSNIYAYVSRRVSDINENIKTMIKEI